MELLMMFLLICLAGIVLSYCTIRIIEGFFLLFREIWRLHNAEVKQKKEKKLCRTGKAARRTKL